MAICLNNLKSEIKTLEKLFSKSHELFQIVNASVDELTCRFISKNGKKYDIHANITVSPYLIFSLFFRSMFPQKNKMVQWIVFVSCVKKEKNKTGEQQMNGTGLMINWESHNAIDDKQQMESRRAKSKKKKNFSCCYQKNFIDWNSRKGKKNYGKNNHLAHHNFFCSTGVRMRRKRKCMKCKMCVCVCVKADKSLL